MNMRQHPLEMVFVDVMETADRTGNERAVGEHFDRLEKRYGTPYAAHIFAKACNEYDRRNAAKEQRIKEATA